MIVPIGPHTLHETTPDHTTTTVPFTSTGFFAWGKWWTWNAAKDRYEVGADWLTFSGELVGDPPRRPFGGSYNGGDVGGWWE
jgi:hypothetical protein